MNDSVSLDEHLTEEVIGFIWTPGMHVMKKIILRNEQLSNKGLERTHTQGIG